MTADVVGRRTVVACPHCDTRNRVPSVADGFPRCGNCGNPLPWIVEAGDDDFAAVAERPSIPVLVDLWASWCGPCRRVSPVLEQLATERAGVIKLVKVDIDQASALSTRFQVQAVPTLLVLRGGEIAARQAGAAPVGTLRRWLDDALADPDPHSPGNEGAVMNRHDLAWQLPLRLTAGTYVLDSGLHKWDPDEDTAKQLHGFATGTYPFLAAVQPVTFTRALAAAEVLVGAALLIPVVPAGLAGLGLVGFGAGLLGLYARTPGMRRPGTPFPTQDGIALAKDSWLVAIGAALVAGDRR